jgi:hypothetical protein
MRTKPGGGKYHVIAEISVRNCALLLAFLLAPAASQGDSPVSRQCGSAETAQRVAAALARIQNAIDPCGDSAEIDGVLADFRRCDPTSYRICIDPRSSRNFVDPGIRDQPAYPTSLTWNPELRTELESSCDGDPSRPVLRDPTASLLHEIVHVVQDCKGLDPGAHEAEAVRIENVYRRARGLCQRTRYGERTLPHFAFVACRNDACGCPPPPLDAATDGRRASLPAVDPGPLNRRAAGDTAAASPAGARR